MNRCCFFFSLALSYRMVFHHFCSSHLGRRHSLQAFRVFPSIHASGKREQERHKEKLVRFSMYICKLYAHNAHTEIVHPNGYAHVRACVRVCTYMSPASGGMSSGPQVFVNSIDCRMIFQ